MPSTSAPGTSSPTLWGSSQHSAFAPSSRARPSATAATIRARSASNSWRSPHPTRIQRRPAACTWASERSFAVASPDSTSAPSVPSGTSCGTPLPSKIPTTIVSAPVSGGSSVVALTSMAGGYRQSHAQDRDPRHRPHARRQARRRPVQPAGHRARRHRHPRRARARGRGAGAGPARRHGPGAAGGRGPDPVAPGADRRRDPEGGLLRDDQQGLRVRRARRRPARRRDPRRRPRGGRRRRHGVDVAGAVPAAAGPLRRAHGRHEGARRDGQGRPHQPVHRASRCSSRRPRSATSWR